MALSRRTLEEMEVGARQVAKNEGREDITPDYMEKVLNTYARYAQLLQWNRDGVIEIRRVRRATGHISETKIETEIIVGDNIFKDNNANVDGTWPTELMFAQIALAVAAGQGRKKDS